VERRDRLLKEHVRLRTAIWEEVSPHGRTYVKAASGAMTTATNPDVAKDVGGERGVGGPDGPGQVDSSSNICSGKRFAPRSKVLCFVIFLAEIFCSYSKRKYT